MVARLNGVQEAGSSNLLTQTKKTVVSNYGCFYFLFRRSFPSGGRKGRVFPTLFLPADISAFLFYLLGFVAGQNAIPSRLFILRSYLFSRKSRRSLQIFSLRPKNSRKQLRLFLFSLSEKFSFRRPERTRFPYFIFTHCRFRFFRFTYSVLSRGKTLFRRGFYFTVLFILS